MSQHKKDFKQPALQFITSAAPSETADQEPSPADHFRGAKEMISPDDGIIDPETPPAGYRKNPLFIENKSRRLQLLVQPSLYKDLKAGAEKSGVSVNEYVHRLLKAAVQKEG